MFRTSHLEAPQGTGISVSRKNKLLFSLFLLFFFGVLYGALIVSYGSPQLIETLSFMKESFLSLRAEQSLLQTFLRSFGIHAALLTLLFLCGFSAISHLVSFGMPAFYGLGFGLSVGYLYASMGAKAILFTVVIILPHSIISTVALVLASRESIRLSNLFLAGFIPKLSGSISLQAVKLYTLKYVILLLFLLAASFLDGLFTFLFARFF